MSAWKSFGWVTGVAFLLRAAALLAIGPNPAFAYTADSASYYEPAHVLLDQGRFATLQNQTLVPELYRTPGYPIFLIPFLTEDGRVHHRAVQWVQAILNALSAGLIFLAALGQWQNQKAAWAAGLGLAFDFVNTIHCTFVLTDILFVFILSIVLLLLVKRKTLWAGLAISMAAFVRPAGLYYPLLLGFILFLGCLSHSTSTSWKKLVLFVLISFLPLSAWMVRNYRLTGRWTFTTIEDANILIVRAALVEADRQHISYDAAVNSLQAAYQSSHGPRSSGAWGTRYLLTHWRDYSKLMMKDVGKLATGNSMKVAAWAILKDDRYEPAATPEFSGQTSLSQAKELTRRHPILGVALVLYLIFLGMTYMAAARGVWISAKQQGWTETLILFSSVLYFVLITLGVDAQARYRLPIMPALFLFAGGGLASFLSKKHAERR